MMTALSSEEVDAECFAELTLHFWTRITEAGARSLAHGRDCVRSIHREINCTEGTCRRKYREMKDDVAVDALVAMVEGSSATWVLTLLFCSW